MKRLIPWTVAPHANTVSRVLTEPYAGENEYYADWHRVADSMEYAELIALVPDMVAVVQQLRHYASICPDLAVLLDRLDALPDHPDDVQYTKEQT